MLARSGLTLTEWVAGMMLSGSTLSDIQASLDFQLALDLRYHGVSFVWSGAAYDEVMQEFYTIAPFSANVPRMRLHTITDNVVRHNEVVLTGTIENMSISPITMHGFWVVGGNLPSRHGERQGAPVGPMYTHAVSGLAPNTSYTTRAVARNVAGGSATGQSPDPIGRFTTRTTSPGQPTIIATTVNHDQRTVQLRWNAPQCSGGLAILRYEAQLNNGAWVTVLGGGSARSHTFPNVPLGTNTFRVRAVTSSFLGAVASTSEVLAVAPTVRGWPGAVGLTSATINGEIENNGGANIAFRGSWHSLDTSGASTHETAANSVSGNNFAVTINNLLPSTAYVARAVARNNVRTNTTGQSGRIAFRTASPQIVAPSAPRDFDGVSTVPGQVNLSWQAPLNNGGAAISRYEVSNNNGVTWVTANSMTGHTFTGLPSGQRTFRVRAVNSAGSGAEASRQINVMVQPTATIRYTAGGGTGTLPASQTVNVPGWVNLRAFGNLTRQGYSPGGWRRNNIIFAIGQRFDASTAGGTYTFDAAWVRNAVTLTFNANGGTPATQQITRVPGSGNTIGTLPSSPTRVGHTFVDWFNTSAATGGTRIHSGTPVPASHTTYYARWTADTLELPVNSWNITAAANANTFTVISNRTWTATSNNPTWLSVINTAPGWVAVTADEHTGATQRTGTITITIPGSNLSLPINVTQHPPIRINLDANGGTVSPQFVTIPQNPVGNVLPTPVRHGVPQYMFAGWFTAPTGGQQVFPHTMIGSGTTLFARWYVHISFNPNGGAGSTRTYDWLAGTSMDALLNTIPVPTRVGATLGQRFDGWFTSQHGGTRVTPATFALNNHHTLYARWVSNIDRNRHNNYWWPSNHIPLQTFRIDMFLPPEWATGMSRGRAVWTYNVDIPVTFGTPSSASNNRVTAQSERWSQLGRATSVVLSGNHTSRFYIELNSRTITDYVARHSLDLTHVVQSVMVHELGHIVGLRDGEQPQNGHPMTQGGFSDASVMNAGRNRANIRTPQAFDIESVRMIYD